MLHRAAKSRFRHQLGIGPYAETRRALFFTDLIKKVILPSPPGIAEVPPEAPHLRVDVTLMKFSLYTRSENSKMRPERATCPPTGLQKIKLLMDTFHLLRQSNDDIHTGKAIVRKAVQTHMCVFTYAICTRKICLYVPYPFTAGQQARSRARMTCQASSAKKVWMVENSHLRRHGWFWACALGLRWHGRLLLSLH